ncbi:hypothetical protein Pmani_005127 [Petrolisthes manimaculis]|uniref:Uncharacterized protein n=1 Tax=Petrolisthes manimaculis TaxID=1843537 RepID=A0AAE1UHV3_9EUCA|nr:hypothetical protein Pmani_005127 [Petrolisthes manimaculis]
MRPPWMNQFGALMSGGNWSGTVGTLQYDQADFSLVLAPTSGRISVVEYSRLYKAEELCIVSHKPKPLPQHLQLIKPLTCKFTS